MAPVLAQWADIGAVLGGGAADHAAGGPTGILPQATPEFLKAFAADRAAMTAGMRRPAPARRRARS